MSKCEVCLNEARVLTATGNGYACDSCTAKMPREHVVAAYMDGRVELRAAAQSRLVAAVEALGQELQRIREGIRPHPETLKACSSAFAHLRAAVEERGKI